MDRTRNRGAQRPYSRMARVNALLQEVLAEEIERLADTDERLRLLTITAVVCDPDLRHATVLFASLPDEAVEALGEHRIGLQASAGAQVRMRRIPVLAFAIDPAIEAGARVEETLRRLRASGSGPAD